VCYSLTGSLPIHLPVATTPYTVCAQPNHCPTVLSNSLPIHANGLYNSLAHSLCTAYLLRIHFLPIPCLFTVEYNPCKLTAYSSSIHCLYTSCSLPIHCIFTVYSLPIRCLFTVYSLPIHCLLPAYALLVHCVFTSYHCILRL
jgi:hypothetical protein